MKPKQIFLSYAREDVKQARQLCRDLKDEYFHVWFDEQSLIAGQKWKREISRAIRTSDFFIALLSENSVTKRGVVQKELKEAIEVMLELPERAIYLIPARLSNCQPSHDALAELHCIDLFPAWGKGVQKIREAMFYEFFVAKKSDDNFKPHGLAGILQQVVDLVHSYATGQKINIDIDVRTDAKVICNEKRLSQALLNILLNAIQHSITWNVGDIASIRTILYATGNTIYLTIENTGNLINPEHIYSGCLFTPFFTTKAKGIGLGLTVTMGIINEHNGTIFVASSPVGLGQKNNEARSLGITNFTIALPMYPDKL